MSSDPFDQVNQESPTICLAKQPRGTPMLAILSIHPVSTLTVWSGTQASTGHESNSQHLVTTKGTAPNGRDISWHLVKNHLPVPSKSISPKYPWWQARQCWTCCCSWRIRRIRTITRPQRGPGKRKAGFPPTRFGFRPTLYGHRVAPHGLVW